ncbi:MAG: BMP family ABC transporter substrate-binding protein [Coriobacteriia bacterium]
MRKKWSSVLALVLVLALVAVFGAGCAKTTEDEGTTSEGEVLPGEGIKVGMVTDTNGLGDKSFNDAVWEGLEMARDELGVEIEVLESNEPADYEPNIDQLAAAGYDIIFTVGFLFTDITPVKAEEYPDIVFGAVDQFFEDPPPNVAAMVFRENEAAYLAGMLAAMVTTDPDFDERINPDPVIGFVGGMDIPPVEKFQAGYIAGARSVNPDIQVISAFVGNFDDQAKAKELAISAIDQGADIVFQAAGLAGLGVIPACVEKGALFIGVDADQYQTAPESQDVILTSALKKMQQPVYSVIEDVVNDEFEGGVKSYGATEDAGGLAPFYNFDDAVTQEMRDALAEAEAGIKDGSIVVPSSRAELE